MLSKSITCKISTTIVVLICIILIIPQIHNKSSQQCQKIQNQVDNFKTNNKYSSNNNYTEEHRIVTEDGYILTIFRIVRDKKCNGKLRKPSVILEHGLLMSSDGWIDSGPNIGLPYLLADACFDVWLGNQRGNYYARQHLQLNPHDDEFWNFSVDEIGLYDIPASIDYVLNVSNEKHVNYIGFSQGSGTFFIMCSEKPEYCDKVKLLIALAPATRHTHTKSLAFTAAGRGAMAFEKEFRKSGYQEVFSRDAPIIEFFEKMCLLKIEECDSFESLIDSYHPGSINSKTLEAMLRHFPAGTSLKNLIRYGQSMNSLNFQKFDYGEVNSKKYGNEYPPSYNLNAVTTPTVILFGRNDYIVDVLDILWLVKELPNVLDVIEVTDPLWNHFDFIYSQYIPKMIFPKIYQYLSLYANV